MSQHTELIANIKTLLSLDAANALVPHGIGGRARTLLKAAADALQAMERMPMTWQPIETAPLTGKAVLVHCPNRKNTYVVFWDQGESQWRHFGGLSSPLLEGPTHWMHLPTPPESKG